MESSIKDIMEALRQRWTDAREEMERLTGSNIALATMVRQIEGNMQTFISHEGAWDRIDVELRSVDSVVEWLRKYAARLPTTSIGSPSPYYAP